jgi:hypothetical protein
MLYYKDIIFRSTDEYFFSPKGFLKLINLFLELNINIRGWHLVAVEGISLNGIAFRGANHAMLEFEDIVNSEGGIKDISNRELIEIIESMNEIIEFILIGNFTIQQDGNDRGNESCEIAIEFSDSSLIDVKSSNDIILKSYMESINRFRNESINEIGSN